MCGIVGYVGPRSVANVILDGLRKLEYRGYDSAGIAVAGNANGLQIRRAAGKLKNLEDVLRASPVEGTYGIGHTRWATHGRPSEENAHPHRDCSGRVVVVHNGIVENYLPLKRKLMEDGHTFLTETDTEVISHLLEHYLLRERSTGTGNLEDAVRSVVKQISGVFAIACMSSDEPDKIIVARSGPPLVVGLGDNEYFAGSDIPALLSYTRELYFLADGDMAILTPAGVKLSDFDGNSVSRAAQHIAWDPVMAEKGGFKHFMLKEIYEQPIAVRDTVLGRISQDAGTVFLEELQVSDEEFRQASKINIVACGTSWHAGLVGKFMLEKLARIPVEVDYAGEYRYRDPIITPTTLTLLITQSGETADTIAAQRESKSKGSKTLAICNVVGAMIARESNGTIYTHAGPEIGVASTKAFTAQMAALFLFALYVAQKRGTVSPREMTRLMEELTRLPGKLESALQRENDCKDLARVYSHATDFLFLGRGIHYPIALEGALKLKEISYIHAEGYPASEMKHGPNALIDEDLPVVVLATQDRESPDSVLRYEKTLSNIKEVTARSGKVIAVATEGDTDIQESVDQVVYVPPAHELLLPIVEIVPLQMLAYHIAVRRGCDVDQPRNLAKSVTVE